MKGRVLVIEDDEKWGRLIKGYLEDADYYVDIVDNLENAIEVLKHQLFHFITVDMQLDRKTTETPDLEGWNILKLAKKSGVELRTPVMVITGYDREYIEFKERNKYKSLFLMGKANFNKTEFIAIVDRSVQKHDLRFFDDKRDI